MASARQYSLFVAVLLLLQLSDRTSADFFPPNSNDQQNWLAQRAPHDCRNEGKWVNITPSSRYGDGYCDCSETYPTTFGSTCNEKPCEEELLLEVSLCDDDHGKLNACDDYKELTGETITERKLLEDCRNAKENHVESKYGLYYCEWKCQEVFRRDGTPLRDILRSIRCAEHLSTRKLQCLCEYCQKGDCVGSKCATPTTMRSFDDDSENY